MRVLVTGGAGFIGSHLCEELLRRGHAVAVLDDLNDFYSPHMKRANLEEIRRWGRVEFREGDIRDEDIVAGLMREHRPEAVIHLAARAGVRPSLSQPLLYEQVNVGGTIVLLEACRRLGVRKFILASSSSVYGAGNAVPFHENELNLRPMSPYAATKLAAEKMCYTYSQLYGLEVVCLRFFTVYGPRQRPDLAIRKFAESMLAGRRIPIYGDGETARDYTFVSDTVEGIVSALDYEAHYEVFNLGNSRPVKLAELVTALEQILGVKALLDRLPDQPGDVPITYADISKAASRLNFQPRTPIEEGLRVMSEWLRLPQVQAKALK
ncbi:MAG: GDP-mannose 4,6-dehydratase [Bryobacteraceae bacterium]|nr:GDP-mannose 4,6-dehydratase [Bryobacteraceae bacterium]